LEIDPYTKTNTLCLNYVQAATIALLGTTPTCGLKDNTSNKHIFEIGVGTNPTINVGDTILLETNKFEYNGTGNRIHFFFKMTISAPVTPGSVAFTYATIPNPSRICADLTFNKLSHTGNGNRLESLIITKAWSLESHVPTSSGGFVTAINS